MMTHAGLEFSTLQINFRSRFVILSYIGFLGFSVGVNPTAAASGATWVRAAAFDLVSGFLGGTVGRRSRDRRRAATRSGSPSTTATGTAVARATVVGRAAVVGDCAVVVVVLCLGVRVVVRVPA